MIRHYLYLFTFPILLQPEMLLMFEIVCTAFILRAVSVSASATQIALSNQGSSYTATLNVGNTKGGAFIIDTTSGDIAVDLNNNFTENDELCAELSFDQSAVSLYSDNCSLSYKRQIVSFGDDPNVTADVIEAEHIFIEDQALHQWGNTSGILGLGNERCSEDVCYNQSRSSFQEMLATIYQTSIFGLDLNNDSTLSFLDIGSINFAYADVFEWAPRQIATFPQYYDFLLHDLRMCEVNIMSKWSTNWQSRIDTASACLTLPGELYDNVLSWLDLTIQIEHLHENVSKVEILNQMEMPDLTFSLNEDGALMHISLKDLVVDSSELINIPSAPKILLSKDGVVASSELSLCLLSGDYVTAASIITPPDQIILGSLALRSLYVGIDVDVGSPRIGFANKRSPEEGGAMASQCAATVSCMGSQYLDLPQNSCRNPDCRKYFYAALNAETHRCEYDNGAIVVGILFIVLFAFFEITAFFVSQYTSYMVIPEESRKFSVDQVTLKIGSFLTILVDKLIVDVLCWIPEVSAGNASVGQQQDEEVEQESEGDESVHNVHMFLHFEEISQQSNAAHMDGHGEKGNGNYEKLD